MKRDRLRLRSAARTRALANVSSSSVKVTFLRRRDLLSAGLAIITPRSVQFSIRLRTGTVANHENANERACAYLFALRCICLSAALSLEADPLRRRLPARWLGRPDDAHPRRGALGAARPAGGGREPAGRRQRARRGADDARRARWLHHHVRFQH